MVSLTLVGCGKKDLGEDTGSYTVTSEGTPFKYKSSDNECSFDELSLSPIATSFHSGVYNGSILSDLSKKTLDKSVTFGGEYEINIARVSTLETLKNPDPFKYCVDKSVIEDTSTYENAALSILQPIREFDKKFGALLWPLKIPKVNIQVLPKYSRIKHTKIKRRKVLNKSYLINNAMYFGAKDTLIFLPQGSRKQYQLPFGGVPLWKSPAVVMHEYAHHVFKHIVIQNNSAIKHFGDSGLCMDSRDLVSASNEEKVVNRSERTKEDALEAINEGFADLFAFYAAGEKPFFKKMGCMEKTRDLQSEVFISNQQKIFSTDALDSFLNTVMTQKRFCGSSVDFQDPHMVGAVIAHGFYKVLESTKMAPYYKLQVVLLWARDLRSKYDEAKDPEELFKFAVESFYERVDTFTGSFEMDCTSYKSIFSFADIKC